MLLNLTITNFAIIDRLEVQFDEGFSVLTGETGAGKSIVLDAFCLLLGDRARPDLVRSGTDEATVEALFDLAGRTDIGTAFCAAGFDVDDELVLRRVVQAGGRSRAYVNGRLATLAQLRPLAELLVAVCGQHEHQSLLRRPVHRRILDRYGALDARLESYAAVFEQLRRVKERLAELDEAERDRTQRLDFLRHQVEEIDTAALRDGEEEELTAERALLQNAERLTGITEGGFDALYGGDGAVCEVLGRLSGELKSVASLDDELGSMADVVERCLFELEDVSARLRSYLGRIAFEPARLEEIEERLALLTKLKRKYAPTINEILTLAATLSAEIEGLANAAETREALAQELSGLERETQRLGGELSAARHEAAAALSQALAAELADLAMPGAAFEAAFTALDEPAAEGLEAVEFMVSLNPGEPLLPLTRVASGGELSRLMLAFKRLAPDAGDVPTVIFDEVDAGIGGEAASAVGCKLQQVGRGGQAICVTHLPQVAAFGDCHYRVVKSQMEGRTRTNVEQVNGEARISEMARMLGGATVTEQTLSHARALVAASAAR
jgi:DNA repair protein RecN (Recombination protein N)